MSTYGARARISAPSAWATQPATAMIMSRPSPRRAMLLLAQAAELAKTFSDAFSRIWQVLRMTMSASAASSAGA